MAPSLEIRVIDNGNGVAEDRLKEIYQNFGQNEGNNIGLKNIYRRLQIYYSGNASLLLQNREDGGFMAQLKNSIEYGGGINESYYY